jgi:hypothetical protein
MVIAGGFRQRNFEFLIVLSFEAEARLNNI